MTVLRTPRSGGATAAPRLCGAILCAFAIASARGASLAQAPAPGEGALFPAEIAWTAALDSAPAADPAADARQIYVPLRSGELVALSLSDGSRRWAVELTVDQPVASGDGLVFLAAEEKLVAVDAGDGSSRWQVEAGSLAAPPLWMAGWLIAGTIDGDLAAWRAADGGPLWRRPLGARLTTTPSIDGDRVYAPLQDGRVLALDLFTGEPVWAGQLGGAAGAILVLQDRLFVGSADRFFYCLALDDGRRLWRRRIGAEIIGRPVADEARVYFAALDNVLWALDRRSGIQRWREPLPFRPSAGPIPAGHLLIVPALAPDLRAYDRRTGRKTAEFTAPAPLVGSPQIVRPVRPVLGIRLALLTGALTGEWRAHGIRPRRYPPPAPLAALIGQQVPLTPPSDEESPPPSPRPPERP